jgi:hypothetical protein
MFATRAGINALSGWVFRANIGAVSAVVGGDAAKAKGWGAGEKSLTSRHFGTIGWYFVGAAHFSVTFRAGAARLRPGLSQESAQPPHLPTIAFAVGVCGCTEK